jgi:Mg2+/Co2+ transporter CorB
MQSSAPAAASGLVIEKLDEIPDYKVKSKLTIFCHEYIAR